MLNKLQASSKNKYKEKKEIQMKIQTANLA